MNPPGPDDGRTPQLVATLGPASLHLAPKLAEAGATALRLNASHMMPGKLKTALSVLRDMGVTLPVVVDLQGAKMRLGTFAARLVRRGDVLRFALNPSSLDELPLPHPELFRAVGQGDTLSCSDDRLRFEVLVCSPEALEARSLTEGMLRPRKGVNIIEHPVDLADLSVFDMAHLDATTGDSAIVYAYSFMKDGREADWIRSRVPGARVVGKVERLEATHRIGSIGAKVDAVWICRGDLAAQLGLAPMARWVSRFDPRQLPCPVLMAGQVLEHLTRHPHPTRSEVCHLLDLLLRGYAGIVLSDETAVGGDPVAALTTAADLLGSLP